MMSPVKITLIIISLSYYFQHTTFRTKSYFVDTHNARTLP